MNCRRIGSSYGRVQSIDAITYGDTRTAIGARRNPSRASSRNVGSTIAPIVSNSSSAS